MTTEIQATELEALIRDIRAQLAALAERVSRLETPAAPAVAAAPAEIAREAPPAALEAPAAPEIGEEELLAISAALAAYFGVRVHVRQIRLISSSAWAQQGRVSIQASHRLF
jgi:methylmalonyl-CoA carboxyltransferase large subunit